MQTSLFLILGIGLLVWLWLDGARAREFAIELARSMCEKRGFQFLDETVEMKRMALRWGGQGIRFRRMFQFDYSIEGMGRRSGFVILVGTQIEVFDLGLPQSSQDVAHPREDDLPEPPRQVQPGDKVVPFKRPPKRK